MITYLKKKNNMINIIGFAWNRLSNSMIYVFLSI